MYYGIGTGKNADHAVRWYRKAAKRGHAEAQHCLADSYVTGEGVKKNRRWAKHWCQKALKGGYVDAQKALKGLDLYNFWQIKIKLSV